MTALVRTVLGDLEAAELGRTDYHEHLFQISPLLPGDELDDEEASGREAAMLRRSGFGAMIDATPVGLGRRPSALARISASRQLHVVAATGAHREPHYPPGHWLLRRSAAELADGFCSDIVRGMPIDDEPGTAEFARGPLGRPVRGGLVKAGIGYWSISAFERRVLEAVAATHGRLNVPVMVHLEHGSAAFQVLDLLVAEGVSPEAVVLAHIDRNPDPALHAELAAAGAYLGYDGFARTRIWPDSTLIDCFLTAADRGAGDRLLLGGDVARRTRYVAYGGMPGLSYLAERVLPRLDAENHALLQTVLIANPARLLSRLDPSAGQNSNGSR